MSSGLSALASIVVASALLAGPSAHRADQESLRGQWRVVRGEAFGKPMSAAHLPNATMTFEADGRWIGTENGVGSGGGTWRVNEATVPATLDLTHTAGLDQGKTQLCVFAVAGDSLTLVLGIPGQGARPTKLVTTAGPPHAVLFVLVRTGK